MSTPDFDEPLHRPARDCPYCDAAGLPDGFLPWEMLSADHRQYHVVDVLLAPRMDDEGFEPRTGPTPGMTDQGGGIYSFEIPASATTGTQVEVLPVDGVGIVILSDDETAEDPHA